MSARGRGLLALVAVAVLATAGESAGAQPAQPVERTVAAGAQPAQAVGRTVAAAPLVQSMIVGAGGAILSPARTVAAASTSVRVAGRTCTVAAGTPMAVLAAVRRLGGPAFTLRDYGRCGRSPIDSGQLFVNSLGGQANRGQDGWEYKVGGVSGSTGAGDPSGPAGDGRRLRSGVAVLWFWCRAGAGGCQRTLEVDPSASTIGPGGSLSVRVLGRDNEGRAVPVAGAIVTLASDFASTGADGRATLVAPTSSGRFQLSASRRGLVPSFPQAVAVG